MSGHPKVLAEPCPHGWRVMYAPGDVGYAMSPDEAEAVGYALIAAAATAKMRSGAERALPLDERVRLFLARLCYMPTSRIAKSLGVDEAAVCVALDALVAAGRVRNMGPGSPYLYEAIDRDGAWPENP